MAPKPSLVLEIDEHSADAGVVTRIEAFLESVGNAPVAELPVRGPLYPQPSLNGRRRQPSENGRQRTIYVHWMGDVSHALAAAFRGCGQPAEVLPVGDPRSMEMGRRLCSGKECLPCILTAGDMIRLTRQKDFDPRRTAFFMPSGSGPCRFGQYGCMHKMILNDLGYEEIPIHSPSQDKEFYDQCEQLQEGVMRLSWYGSCAMDVLHQACLAIRPYELEAGRTDEVYGRWRRQICRVIEAGPSIGRLAGQMTRAADDFAAIPADRSRRRPLIGVVGEIYIRHHSFANNDVLRQLERIGAETTLAGFPEWMYYTNWIRKGEARRDRKLRSWLTNFLEDVVMRKSHRRLCAAFEPLLGPIQEPPIEELIEMASPYLHPSFQGEAILSIGKMIELCRHGCAGVVNVMPFTCMPSTIVGGVMNRLTAALGDMPTLSISYDGQQDPMLQTRLEAFIYQARAYQATKAEGATTR